MPTDYPDTTVRPLTDIIGDRLSILSFGALGDGIHDDSVAINRAITSVTGLSGRDLYFPGGRNYLVNAPLVFPTGVSRIRVSGDGDATKIIRGASMPTDQGVFDIRGASYVQFRNFRYSSGISTSTGLLYSALGGDPMAAPLVQDSGFWIHGGSRGITFDGVTFNHASGYSILVDARFADVFDIEVLRCLFENNRQHLFGVDAGDLNYGSWTGGIHYQGDGRSGALFGVENLLVDTCQFKRNTGHGVWGHAYGLDKPHTNVRVVNSLFQDCGLDGALFGVVTGGKAEGNTFRRIGYICTDDTSPSTPRWISGGAAYAVGLDTSGRVVGVSYKGNTFMSCNGGCMDLDGFAEGTVDGNTCVMPQPGDPEYVTDDIAHTGPASNGLGNSYGVQVGNTNNDPVAGRDVNINGNTLIGMGCGAVRLYAGRGCAVTNNQIVHPANATYCPITLGNVGPGANQRAYDNVVTGNRVAWSPASSAPAVVEDAYYGDFQATDRNWVYDNRLIGTNLYEFLKHSTSGSGTRIVLSSAGAVTDVAQTQIQREGGSADGYTRFYRQLGNTGQCLMTLLDSALLNVADGTVGGVISTGNRTASSLVDAMLTGKMFVDGFLSLQSLTYSGAQANTLPDTYGLIRYDPSTKTFLKSTSVSGGVRVWSEFGGQPPGGLNTQVQYNASGAFGGSSGMTWNDTTKLLTLSGNTGTAALAVVNAFISSGEGFYSVSALSNAVNIPNGGVTAKYFSIFGAATWTPVASSVSPPATGYGRIYFETTTKKLMVSEDGGAYRLLVNSGGIQTGSDASLNSLILTGGSLSIPNNQSIRAKLQNGSAYVSLLTYGTDNNLYVDNAYANILIRPNVNQYIVMGAASGGSAVVPARNLVVDLGVDPAAVSGYRWRKLWVTDIDLGGRLVTSGSWTTVVGSLGVITVGTTVTNNASEISSMRMRNTFNGSGDYPQALDMAPTFAPSASISLARGFVCAAYFAPGAGVTIVSARGGDARCVYSNAAGAVTAGTGFLIDSALTLGSLHPITQYGLRVANQGMAGTTTSYGIYVDSQSGSVTNYSAIFAGGNVGIGTAYPGYKLEVVGSAGVAAIAVSTAGFISSAEGFYSPSTNYAALHALGGCLVKQLTLTESTQPSGGAGVCALYADSTTHKLRVNLNNAGWVDVATGLAGVTSLCAYGYSALTGAVVIAAGNNIAVTQNGQTLSVALSASVVDATGTFVGVGVSCPSYGVTAAGFNPYVGGIQYNGVQSADLYFPGGFQKNGVTANNIQIRGGVIVNVW